MSRASRRKARQQAAAPPLAAGRTLPPARRPPRAAPARRQPLLTALAACLFLSGAASLMLEVVWTRLLRLVFGSTTLAVSTVLVAYMLGLGLGGLVGGRLANRLDNKVRAYGQMELGIAAYALVVPWLLAVFPLLNRTVLAPLSFWPAALGRFVVVLVALLVPTMLMGATLPVLVGALVRQHAVVAARVGLLYGLNTLGAVCGVLLSTFLLLPALGVRWTNWAAALLDAIVGALALWRLAPRAAATMAAAAIPPRAQPAPVAPTAVRAAWRNPAVLAYGVVGFTALACEVCWTRTLALVLGSSIYAFATMLVAFLTGIALGSLFGRRWFDRLRQPIVVYAAGVALLGVFSLVTLRLFGVLPELFAQLNLSVGMSPARLITSNIVTALLAMLVPTLILGALFPLVVGAIAAAPDEHSRTVGDVYFVNTVGSALGAFLTGFLLVPMLGLRQTLALAAALNMGTAGVLVVWQRAWGGHLRPVLAGGAVVIACLTLAFPPQWDQAALTRGRYRDPVEHLDVGIELLPLIGLQEEQLLYYRDGINTTVSVDRAEGDTVLRVNGKPDASNGVDMPTQVLLGELPMLFGPRAQHVLAIGLASGITVGSLALHLPEHLDVVELEPAMLEVVRFFDDVNHQPLSQPVVRVIADDGRTFVAAAHAAYDVIVSEPSNPWITGAASLFTRDFFHSAKLALRPGGRLFQWVQLYGFDPASLRGLLAALHAELPYVYGFAQAFGSADLLLLATETPLGPEHLPRWEALPEAVRDDLRRINTFSTSDLWSLMRYTPVDVEALSHEATIVNSDDNMFIELAAPWALHDPGALDANWRSLARFGHGVLPLAELGGQALDAEMLGALALSYIDARGDTDLAAQLVETAEQRGGSVSGSVAKALVARAQTDDTAGTILDDAVARAPQAFVPRFHRARLENGAGQNTEALTDIDVALHAAPDDLRARFVRMTVLNALDRSAEARPDAKALLASPYAQLDLDLTGATARTAAAAHDFEDGIREMLHYLDRNPQYAEEWTVLATMYDASGRAAAARDARTNAERAARNRVLYMHRVARREIRRGNIAAAVDDLNTALELDPSYTPARDELIRLNR